LFHIQAVKLGGLLLLVLVLGYGKMQGSD